MNEYEFEFTFRLPVSSEKPEEHLEALGQYCDDAICGIGKTGEISLSFIREEKSAAAAIISAYKDVRKAIPGASIIEAKPDLLGLSDLAKLINSSRQNVRKILVRSTAPKPIYVGSTSLWHLSSLAGIKSVANKVSPAIFEVANITRSFNSARELVEHPVQDEVKLLIQK